jgi:trehalose 6-phosphate synthase/phosphatase
MTRLWTDPNHPIRRFSPPEVLHALIERTLKAKKLVLLLDYDGTLVEFHSSPRLALPDVGLLKLLRSLSQRPGTFVHLVSGRQKDTLENWFDKIHIGLHAEHGFWSRLAGETTWRPYQQDVGAWKTKVIPILEQYAANTPGTLIEEKTAGLTWHYRMTDPETGCIKSKALYAHLVKVLREWPVEVLKGEKIVEVRLQGVHKGRVVQSLLLHYLTESDSLFVGMGDDQTDEDMFAALPANGVAIHVGSRESRAAYQLADPTAARGFLEQILRRQR